MMDQGVHIWAKRAVVPIPEGAVVFEEEPMGEEDVVGVTRREGGEGEVSAVTAEDERLRSQSA